MKSSQTPKIGLAAALLAAVIIAALWPTARTGPGAQAPAQPATVVPPEDQAAARPGGLRPRIAPPRRSTARADEAPAAAPAGEIIGGYTAEQRKSIGLTPQRLYAAKQGARLQFAAQMLRPLGHDELADAAETLGRDLEQARDREDEAASPWDELMSRHVDLADQIVKVALDHPDNEVFLRFALMGRRDLESAMHGELPSVKDKVAAEPVDGEKRGRDEVGEDQGKGTEPDGAEADQG